MARLPYVDPESAPEPIRKALQAGPPLNVFRMLAHAETAFRPLLRVGSALLAQGELDPRLRELAILRVAALSRAEYEWVQHAQIAKTLGIPDDQLAALQRGDAEAECFDPLARLVLRFTTEVVQDVGASEQTFTAARENFSPREIVELLLCIGYYMALARVMVTTDLDLDPPLGDQVVDSAERASGRNSGA